MIARASRSASSSSKKGWVFREESGKLEKGVVGVVRFRKYSLSS
jgi:hypothetical protein